MKSKINILHVANQLFIDKVRIHVYVHNKKPGIAPAK